MWELSAKWQVEEYRQLSFSSFDLVFCYALTRAFWR